MLRDINQKWSIICKLNKEFDEIYHKIASHYGMSDSAFWILYVLYENRNSLTQKEICNYWCSSKQTINSAIKDLENKDYINLIYEDGSRKSKKINLTKKGIEFSKRTIKNVMKAEEVAFSKVDEKEFDKVISFFEKQIYSLKEEVNNII